MSDLALAELLAPGWQQVLEPVIVAQKPGDLQRFLSPSRPWTIPSRPNTFAALRGRDAVHQWNVVILGQDPYPREESAVGIAFNDGAIKKWTDKFNPSFTNIMKSVMIHEGKMPLGGDIDQFRKVAKSSGLVDPPAWFEHSQREGVMWLNTSLTFSSKEIPVLKEHTTFWAPIITAVFQTLIEAKKDRLRKDPSVKEGLVFIMWGSYAQKFRKTIEALNAKTKPALPIEFVENNHPAATGDALVSFHRDNSFTQANGALKRFGLAPVRWFVTAAEAAGPGGAAQPAPAPTPDKKRKASAAADAEEEGGAAAGEAAADAGEADGGKGRKTKAAAGGKAKAAKTK